MEEHNHRDLEYMQCLFSYLIGVGLFTILYIISAIEVNFNP